MRRGDQFTASDRPRRPRTGTAAHRPAERLGRHPQPSGSDRRHRAARVLRRIQGRTAFQLACKAVKARARRHPARHESDVDGLVAFTLDNRHEMKMTATSASRGVAVSSAASPRGGASAGTKSCTPRWRSPPGSPTWYHHVHCLRRRFPTSVGNFGGTITSMPLFLWWPAPFGLLSPASSGRHPAAPVHPTPTA